MSDNTVPLPEPDCYRPDGTGNYFNAFTTRTLIAYGDAREVAAKAEVERLRAEIDHVDAERVVAKGMQRLHSAEVERLRAELDAIKAADALAPDVAYRHMHEDGWEYYDAPTGSDCNGCEPLVRRSDALAAVAAAAAQNRETTEPLLWALLGAERDWICTSATPPYPDEARAEHITNGAQWYALTPLSYAAPQAAAEPSRSQKLRDAGFTRRPTWRSLPKDGDDEASPEQLAAPQADKDAQ